MRKGISPFIASVLLIAFAITVASIYSGWITGFTKETTEEVKEKSEKRVTCSYGGVALDDLEYNSTSGNLTGMIENTDIIPLGNIDLEIFYNNATREKKDLNMELEPGEKNTFNQAINDNYDKVRIYTNCSNVYDELSSSDVSSV